MEYTSLVNHFLIALPALKDPNFERAVIFLCEHQAEGAIGLIINRPMQFPLQIVFDQLNIVPDKEVKNETPLLFGGPIQPERGFVLHRPSGGWRSSLVLQEDVTVTTSNDIIRAIASNKGPKDALITLGYTGWGESQLEQELMDNAWLVCPFKAELLYEVPFSERWVYAGSTLGVNMYDIASSAGHA